MKKGNKVCLTTSYCSEAMTAICQYIIVFQMLNDVAYYNVPQHLATKAGQ